MKKLILALLVALSGVQITSCMFDYQERPSIGGAQIATRHTGCDKELSIIIDQYLDAIYLERLSLVCDSKTDKTVLHIACERCNEDDMVAILETLYHNLDFNHFFNFVHYQNEEGKTAYQCIPSRGDTFKEIYDDLYQGIVHAYCEQPKQYDLVFGKPGCCYQENSTPGICFVRNIDNAWCGDLYKNILHTYYNKLKSCDSVFGEPGCCYDEHDEHPENKYLILS